jgi:hypothetical protein
MRVLRAVLPAAAAFAVTIAFAAAAQEWRERAYDPAPGSKWTIQRDIATEETTVENGRTTVLTGTLKITSELTVQSKTPDGFRIAYRRTKSQYDGNEHDPATMRAALGALDNILIVASTDRTGKPLRVDNLGDIRNGLRQMIDRMSAARGNAADAAQLRALLARMTAIDAAQAAQLYLDEVPALALGQNTGLKPGEARRSTEQIPTPIGAPLVKTNALSIVSADPATGKLRLTLTESYDEASMRAFLTELGRHSGLSASDVQKMKISLEAKTEMDVEDGMTRRINRVSTTSNDRMGNRKVTVSRKLVTVTPAR